ncbi:MAG: hypothetical protein LBE84_12385 [Planctomycetota bacterium]|jgi:hypothetical protein|nr:hypothetical protein [Planctomycetota bacterium]
MAKTIVLILLLAAFGRATAGEDPEIAIHLPPPAWNSQGSIPLVLDIRTNRGGEFRVSARSAENMAGVSHTLRRTVSLPPGTAARVEMAFPFPFGLIVEVEGPGVSLSRELTLPFVDWKGEDSSSRLICANSFLFRELNAWKDAGSREGPAVAVLALDSLPDLWQSYSGLTGVLVMEAREARSLRPARREALAIWVRWFGGRLWLAGPEAEEAAREIGFTMPIGTDRETAVRLCRQLNGAVFIQPRPDAGELIRNLPGDPQRNPLAPYYLMKRWDDTPGRQLLGSFPGISVNSIILALLALGVVMGPLNLWFIKRRKTPLLFFVTTPLAAFAGVAGVFAASLWSEGFGGSYTQWGVLVRGAEKEAMLFDGRGVRSGFFVSIPRFSSDTLIFPFRNSGQRLELISDVSDGTVLAEGWLKPRSVSGFLAVRPVASRMNVEVIEEGGEWLVANGLGVALSEVAAALPGGGGGWAKNVPPGNRAPLRREKSPERLEKILERAYSLFNDKPAFAGVALAAECEGLPYLEDGGLGAVRLQGEYFYIQAGIGPEEAEP